MNLTSVIGKYGSFLKGAIRPKTTHSKYIIKQDYSNYVSLFLGKTSLVSSLLIVSPTDTRSSDGRQANTDQRQKKKKMRSHGWLACEVRQVKGTPVSLRCFIADWCVPKGWQTPAGAAQGEKQPKRNDFQHSLTVSALTTDRNNLEKGPSHMWGQLQVA